jgi:hypothetical protein
MELKKVWNQIELPESIGRLKPTEIAVEPEPKPFIIIENKHSKNNIEKNDYDIYNIDDSYSNGL